MNQTEAREYTRQTAQAHNLPMPPDLGPWRAYLTNAGGDSACLCYDCPACGYNHVIPVTGPKAWGWNSRLDLPSLSPSVNCTYPPGHEVMPTGGTCHHFLTDGAVEACGDTSDFEGRAAAGKKLPLLTFPPFP